VQDSHGISFLSSDAIPGTATPQGSGCSGNDTHTCDPVHRHTATWWPTVILADGPATGDTPA